MGTVRPSNHPAEMPVAIIRPQPIIGREREQAQLRGLLDAAISGHGPLVLVSGEAGIGKTTLVNDLITSARDEGCLILAGGCYDLTTTPPYGPWTEALRRYQPEDDQPPVPAWFSDPDAMGEVGSQRALFEQARRFFAGVADTHPLVLVLEDLHWSDGASLEALRHLARTLRETAILLVVTYREDELTRRHELYQLLPLLVRESQAHRIHLHQLDHANIEEMVSSRYDLEESDVERLVEHVAERSEGNPFFAGEILQGLEDERLLHLSSEGWSLGDLEQAQVPQLLRQVLDQRLVMLTPETLSTLQVAAVIGQNVPLDLWQEVTKLDASSFDQAIAEALETRILDEAPTADALAFRHALLREALYESLILNRRRVWHRTIGEALSETPNAEPETVARHFQESGDPRAARWLIRAAVRAEESYAFRIAADHYAFAQALLEAESDSTQVRGWLLTHIGHLIRSFDHDRSLAYLDDALDIARQIGDPVLEAYSQNNRGIHFCNRGNYQRGLEDMEQAYRIRQEIAPEQLQAARQVIASVFPASVLSNPRRLSGGGLAQVGALSSIAGLHAYALQLASSGRFREAIEVGEPHVEQVAQATENKLVIHDHCRDAYFGLFRAYADLGQPERARRWWELANDAYRSINHQLLLAGTYHYRMMYLLTYDPENVDGRRRASEAAVSTGTTYSEALGIESGRAWNTLPLHILEGRWESARELLRQRSEPRWPLAWRPWLQVTTLLSHEGEDSAIAWDDVRRRFPNLRPDEPGNANFQWSIAALQSAASLSLDAGELEDARMWIEGLDQWLEWSGAVIGRSEANLLWARYHRIAGDPDKAHRHAEAALDHAADPRQPLALIAAHRFLGELDTEAGQFDEAAEHLQASLDLAERCQAPYEIALTQLAQAELAVAMRDVPRATHLLDQAIETFEQLGAKRSLECARRVASMVAARTRSYPAGLTPREVEVLYLIADGMSNREMAERLYLSTRTVERHVANIYNKIDVNNRVDAAAFATKHALTPPDSPPR